MERHPAKDAGEPLTTTRECILGFCVAYIQFPVETPHSRSFIQRRKTHLRAILEANPCPAGLIRQYCKKAQILESLQQRKLFGVRSLLYGAALRFDNGELHYTPENLESMRHLANHELDLPKPRSQKAPHRFGRALFKLSVIQMVSPQKRPRHFHFTILFRLRQDPLSSRSSPHCQSLEAMSENTCSLPCSFRISCRILG